MVFIVSFLICMLCLLIGVWKGFRTRHQPLARVGSVRRAGDYEI